MRYAKVVFGLPVEGPFDYIIEKGLQNKVKPGCRVLAPFGRQKITGYVVGLSGKSAIKNLKTITALLDESPALNKNMLLLTKKLSLYYCCSWGQAIETSLPPGLRKGRGGFPAQPSYSMAGSRHQLDSLAGSLLCQASAKKWEAYSEKISLSLAAGKNVIVVLPDKTALAKTEEFLKKKFNVPIAALERNQPGELARWLEIKQGKIKIAIGTRSCIFAPLDNLGLIIIDEEQAYGHKQDQTPHYHSREIGILRAKIEQAELLLGSSGPPSLESIFLSGSIPEITNLPEIKIIDSNRLPLFSKKRGLIIPRYIQDSIVETLNSKGKVLVFLNRKGFATGASCISCSETLKCPRCSTNLVFFYKENSLNCRYCNFKMLPPKICPACNAGYIRYTGIGAEKIESELARLFPQAKIGADITIATQAIFKETELKFNLVIALSIDDSLNHIDFRASEKAFELLLGLCRFTNERMAIQTNNPRHPIFKALSEKNAALFYEKEFKLRKQLGFPPCRHFARIKLRAKNEDKVKAASNTLFENLKKNKKKQIKILALSPGYPEKLRDNHYQEILLSAKSPFTLSSFIKTNLQNFPHSGIIVTVDVDPI